MISFRYTRSVKVYAKCEIQNPFLNKRLLGWGGGGNERDSTVFLYKWESLRHTVLDVYMPEVHTVMIEQPETTNLLENTTAFINCML